MVSLQEQAAQQLREQFAQRLAEQQQQSLRGIQDIYAARGTTGSGQESQALGEATKQFGLGAGQFEAGLTADLAKQVESTRQFDVNQALAQQQFGLQSQLGQGQLALQQQLGTGGLGLEQERLAQAGSQFGQQFGLSQEALAEQQRAQQAGEAYQQQQLSQAGSQFGQQLGLQSQLGMGGLGLQEQGLAEQIRASQAGEQLGGQQLGLQSQLGLGQLGLGQASLAQQGQQFGQGLAEQQAARLGQQGLQAGQLTGQFGGQQTLGAQQLAQQGGQFGQTLAEQQAARQQGAGQFQQQFGIQQGAFDRAGQQQTYEQHVGMENLRLNEAQLAEQQRAQLAQEGFQGQGLGQQREQYLLPQIAQGTVQAPQDFMSGFNLKTQQQMDPAEQFAQNMGFRNAFEANVLQQADPGGFGAKISQFYSPQAGQPSFGPQATQGARVGQLIQPGGPSSLAPAQPSQAPTNPNQMTPQQLNEFIKKQMGGAQLPNFRV